jgi:membrane protease YdiL (CAAX protease family)
MSAVRRHPLITFFVLTYAISWVGLPLYAAGVWPIPFLATGPLIAALIVIPLTQGQAGLRELGSRMIRWQVGWIWWALAIGLPLGVHLVTAGLNVAAGAGVPSLAFGSVTTFLLMFAVRMVNPLDGPLGEEPGWRGFALPGLQSTLSPLVSTLILAVLITGWHLPLFFLEEGGLQPSFIVTAVLSTVAVTFWYNWLFNRTGGSVLMTLVAHNIEGDIQAQGWIYMGVWLAVAIGLVVFDWQFWRGPAPAPATFQPAYGGERRVR